MQDTLPYLTLPNSSTAKNKNDVKIFPLLFPICLFRFHILHIEFMENKKI